MKRNKWLNDDLDVSPGGSRRAVQPSHVETVREQFEQTLAEFEDAGGTYYLATPKDEDTLISETRRLERLIDAMPVDEIEDDDLQFGQGKQIVIPSRLGFGASKPPAPRKVSVETTSHVANRSRKLINEILPDTADDDDQIVHEQSGVTGADEASQKLITELAAAGVKLFVLPSAHQLADIHQHVMRGKSARKWLNGTVR